MTGVGGCIGFFSRFRMLLGVSLAVRLGACSVSEDVVYDPSESVAGEAGSDPGVTGVPSGGSSAASGGAAVKGGNDGSMPNGSGGTVPAEGVAGDQGAAGDLGESGAPGGSGDEPICVPNQPLCVENRATQCNAEGTGHVGGTQCSSTQTCVDGVCENHECPAADLFCSGGVVRECAGDGLSSEAVMACADDEYCDAETARCEMGVCAPDLAACDGNRAATCNASGSGYLPGGVSCGATATCEAGACRPHVCAPEESFCQGQEVKRCSEDGLSSMVEATCTTLRCVESNGDAACTGVCTPEQTRCAENGVQTCGTNGQWEAASACTGSMPYCYSGACTASPPSCQGPASNCGPSANEDCCASPLVTGGTFNRSNFEDFPATVSSFRLDKYEVTVGRFRKFVDAMVSGWLPPSGSGKHSHLNGGSGLANSAASGFEPGWDTEWSEPSLPYRMYSSRVDWDASLACDATFQAYTSGAGSNETRPVNCVNWYQSYAFCIWDGGFLPSEAEWNYAQVGGSQQRDYPWGAAVPGTNTDLAVWGCFFNGTGTCTGVTNLAPVGSVPAGNGRYGQSDLGGNIHEFTLDVNALYSTSECDNCAHLPVPLPPLASRVALGGSFWHRDAFFLDHDFRGSNDPENPHHTVGFRCARRP